MVNGYGGAGGAGRIPHDPEHGDSADTAHAESTGDSTSDGTSAAGRGTGEMARQADILNVYIRVRNQQGRDREEKARLTDRPDGHDDVAPALTFPTCEDSGSGDSGVQPPVNDLADMLGMNHGEMSDTEADWLAEACRNERLRNQGLRNPPTDDNF